MDELQAGVERALAVLPQPSVLFQPREAAFDDPALGHDLEGVQFAAFGDLHRDLLAQDLSYALGERLSGIAAIAQQVLHVSQVRLATMQALERAFAIGHFRRRHRDSVRQALGIDGDVTLDTRDLLAGVIALLAGRVRVLHALRIHDQERAASVAPLSLAGRANLIF